ncbi:MAG: hypothetical protein K2O42_01510, partial [Oscillospiraceae bacterium]|nr:hypothetical protein [Oscillospiraceae bacterium]
YMIDNPSSRVFRLNRDIGIVIFSDNKCLRVYTSDMELLKEWNDPTMYAYAAEFFDELVEECKINSN